MKFQKPNPKKIIISLIISLAIASYVLYDTKSWLYSLIAIVVVFTLIQVYLLVREKLKESAKIKKMETVFPDFIELMASNLRAGMTIDKALLISSRKEFSPLDEEILKVGKEIITGEEIDHALIKMSDRINSVKIQKTINIILSGIRSGGNLAVLLEQTAINLRERNFVEKRAASNVLMYVIFIFFAVAVGAPTLFGLSSILVSTLTNILSTLPEVQTTVSLPFSLTKINVSLTFITYFSLIFIATTDIMASLILGLVSKGEEKAGVKYMIPLIAISLTVYFVIRLALANYFSGLLG